MIDLLIEAWRPIIDGRYEVSNYGQIRSWYNEVNKKRQEPKIMAPWQSGRLYKNGKRGALSVILSTPNGLTRFKVHHLVLEAFVCPKPEGFECAHLDGDITNNRLDNLEWVTHKENEGHKRIHGTLPCGEKATCVKLTEDQVREIRKLYGKFSHQQIADIFKVNRKTIGNIINRVNWKHVE